jgi:hypothetical protein
MTQQTSPEIDLRTSQEVAKLLGVSIHCLIHWRQISEGPPWTLIGPRRIAYDMRDLATWLASRRHCPKTEKFDASIDNPAASMQGAL